METVLNHVTPLMPLLGRVAVRVQQDGEELRFDLDDGAVVRLYHEQECCEEVYIESIVGELGNLVGSPIMVAEGVIGDLPKLEDDYENDSYTWTFYKFRTIKGSVDVRWYGSSNGCYGESVDICVTDPEKKKWYMDHNGKLRKEGWDIIRSGMLQ